MNLIDFSSCCTKRVAIWQKITSLAFQLTLRDQRGWVCLDLISDSSQFSTTKSGQVPRCNNSLSYTTSLISFANRFDSCEDYWFITVSLVEFNTNFHEHRFTNSTVSWIIDKYTRLAKYKCTVLCKCSQCKSYQRSIPSFGKREK